MKTIKVSEATELQLDWLVAKCEGLKLHRNALLAGQVKEGWWVSGYYMDPNNWIPLRLLNLSTNWAAGGPIIERELIDLLHVRQNDLTVAWDATFGNDEVVVSGPTILIAGMRCYVASKLGAEVEIPDELV